MKLSTFVAAVAWVSFFGVVWSMLLGRVASDWTTWLFLVLFLLIALMSGAQSYGSEVRQTRKNLGVKK